MFRLVCVQCKKVFLRNDVRWILAIFAILPILISFLISIESGIIQIGDSVFTAMGYASVVVGLLNSLLLVSVTMALTSTSVISKEIDSGLDCMYVTKVRHREHIIASKIATLDMLVVATFAVLVVSALIGWYAFLRNSPFGTDIFWSDDKDESFMLLYTVVGSFLEMIVMTKMYVLFSLLFKYSKAIVFNFVTIVLLRLLANIEQISKWIPSYIGAGTDLYGYVGNELLQHGMSNVALLLSYAIVISVIDYFIYMKIDLCR